MTDPLDPAHAPLPSRRAMREAETRSAAASGTPEGPAQSARPRLAGITAIIGEHPRIWLTAALGVAFMLLGTGAVFAGVAAGAPVPVAAPEPSPSVSEAIERPVPASMPSAHRVGTCSIAGYVTDDRLGEVSGQVVHAATGAVLYDRNGTEPLPTASVAQILTAAAVLSTLGPDARLTTRVVAGSSPGTIVLVGGGDPTLATTTATLYEGAPLIGDLAAQVQSNYPSVVGEVPITQIVLDATMWPAADSWDSSWPASTRTSGAQAPVTALMVDGGRADPGADISPRSADPVADAGRAFADALGVSEVAFSSGAALSSTLLGQVQSQPMSVLVEQMLQTSDSALAENLARVLARSMGMNGSAESAGGAVMGALQRIGLEPDRVVLRDASGRSDLNRVPASYVNELLRVIHAGEHGLGAIRDAMPVANRSGDLYSRFEGSPVAGSLVAVPGYISTERSLAGLVTAADGTPLAFTFYAIKDGIGQDARDALDALATAVYACGSNLSSY